MYPSILFSSFFFIQCPEARRHGLFQHTQQLVLCDVTDHLRKNFYCIAVFYRDPIFSGLMLLIRLYAAACSSSK